MVPIKEIATLVAHKAYEQKKDPNKVFLEVIARYPQATEEHKKRVVEMANKKLFHLYYRDGVYEFPVIDPKIVLMANKPDKQNGLSKAASVSTSTETGVINPADFEIDGTFAAASAEASGGVGELPTPRWWKQASEEDKTGLDFVERMHKLARVEEILSGKGMKIPSIELIRPYVDPKIVENLEFKKSAGAQEDESLAKELLQLLVEVGR